MDYETALFVGGPRDGDRMVVIKGASRIESQDNVKPFAEGTAGYGGNSYDLVIYVRDEIKPEPEGGDIRFVYENVCRMPSLSYGCPTPV